MIDTSEGIDVNKTYVSKECHICHYWHFLGKGFEFEPYVCNDCHDVMQKAINFSDVAIISVKGSDYRIYFWNMRKDDAMSNLKNFNLNEKSKLL